MRIFGSYTHGGENSFALGKLGKAFEEWSSWMAYLAADPIFDRLRSEPRFHDLVRRLGLPE